MNEFEFIASQLKPLAGSLAGALNLEDDAAILRPEKGQEFVVTTDALTAGIHFFATDPPQLIAQKCLRVNLSDIAAMAQPQPSAARRREPLPAGVDVREVHRDRKPVLRRTLFVT